jgi:hypothetical protein
MQRVLGVGGIFFRARDPKALGAWYRDHLGVELESWGGAVFRWDAPGSTVWSPFKEGTPDRGHSPTDPGSSALAFRDRVVVRVLDSRS